jgi:hypothetical protein
MNEQKLFRQLLDLLNESSLDEVSPPGWGKTVEKMKKHKEIDNPFALAWSMKKKGYEPHYKEVSEETVEEKWGTATTVSPEEKGKYKGKTKAELLKSYNELKKSGPHKKGSPEYGRMRELAFAIRAKSNWGKVSEE